MTYEVLTNTHYHSRANYCSVASYFKIFYSQGVLRIILHVGMLMLEIKTRIRQSVFLSKKIVSLYKFTRQRNYIVCFHNIIITV